MLSILILIPGFVSLYYVARQRVDIAFLWVYLPCLLLLPDYYAYRLPHLPPVSAAQVSVIPIASVVLAQSLSRWKLSRMDLWVVLFVVSMVASEVLRERVFNDGVFLAMIGIITMLLPYIVGRQLIEPRLRLPTVRNWVIFILCLLPDALYEYRFGASLYVRGGTILGLGDLPWSVQYRSGHARISMSFSDAELAGIAFAVTFFFNLWLMELNKNDKLFHAPPRIGKRLAKLQKYYIPALILLAFVFFTQSRGPMMGAALGFLMTQCTRFKSIQNIRIATVVAIILLVFAVIGAFVYFQHYTSPEEGVALTEQQESAMYRRRLLENYQPALEEGGWLGWGIQSYPIFPGQKSIDNDFLLVQLVQGRLGVTLWYLILIESLWSGFRAIWKAKEREDIVFAFTHLAGVLTVWLTLTTCYLGEQLPQVLFLILGWQQSFDFRSVQGPRLAAQEPEGRFKFKRVIV
jgi:hypothetical protein